MTKLQEKHYRALSKDMVTQVREDEFVVTPTILALMTTLRELLVCPRILGIDDDGAAIKALAEDYTLEPHPAVIFTPFVKAIPYIMDALMAPSVGAEYIGTIRGGMKPEDLAREIKSFQMQPVQAKVLIASVGVATSWAATEASTCYFIGYDWSPSVNTQAEDRLHRSGQKNAVTVRYFVHEKTIDRHVLEILDGKTNIAELILDTRNYLYD
jgi:SNF2 family DNA or RNA helicase